MRITDLTVVPLPNRDGRMVKARVRVVLDGEMEVRHILLAAWNRVPIVILPRSPGGTRRKDVEFRDQRFYDELRRRIVEEYNRQLPDGEELPMPRDGSSRP